MLDERGYVQPTNDAARRWLEAGVFDDIKRQGTETYQDRMAAILGLTGRRHRYVLALGEDERRRGRAHLASIGLDPARPVVGLNTGAGGRWPLKQWREDGYLELIARLGGEATCSCCSSAGRPKQERNERLKARSAVRLWDPGCHNSARHFAALVGGCDVMVTGDTLAMHVSLALGRRTVVLFGPTSAPENRAVRARREGRAGHGLSELLQDQLRLRAELHGPDFDRHGGWSRHETAHDCPGRAGGAPDLVIPRSFSERPGW